VSLDRIEFWQGDKYRLHDRIVYTRRVGTSGNAPGDYSVERLCP
jgi:pyridoxine/pyridoxamine 5'-phosphate oxidase